MTLQANGALLMTAAALDELRADLARLRARTRGELAHDLREARTYGSDSNNDEYHAVREEQMIHEARILALEETIARARLVDHAGANGGVAAIGSIVLVEDLASGAVSQYRLAGAHEAIAPDVISAASPMGRALVGALPGTVATVNLPNGRSRTVRLAKVTNPSSPDLGKRVA